MSDLNLDRPEAEDREDRYALVRRAGNLPEEDWPTERINAVQRMYGDEATSLAELATFLHVAQRHDLDPALNEVYLIPTKRGPKVYAGRDGYIKAASRYEGYNGHQSGVVYEEDDFSVHVQGADVEVDHSFEPNTDRGEIHGAYCVVYGQSERPTVVYREFEQCVNRSSTAWRNHPDDMIENRAIAAALRRQVPLGGLLIRGEERDVEQAHEEALGSTIEEDLDDLEAELGVREEESGMEDIPEAEYEVQEPDQSEEPQEPQRARPAQQEDLAKLQEKFRKFVRKFEIPDRAIKAWAMHSGQIPEDIEDWNADHYLVAVQALKQTSGKEVLTEYARYLVSTDDGIGMTERLELEDELGSAPDRRTLWDIIERLEEREG